MSFSYDDPSVTAYALNELPPQEKARVEGLIAQSPQAQAAVDETRRAANLVEDAYRTEPPPDDLAETKIDTRPDPDQLIDSIMKEEPKEAPKASSASKLLGVAGAAVFALLGAGLWWALHQTPPPAPPAPDHPPAAASSSLPPPLPDSAFNVHPAPPAPASSAAFADAPLVPADGGPAPKSASPSAIPPPAPQYSAADDAARAAQKQKLDELRARVDADRKNEPPSPPPAPSAYPEIVVPPRPAPKVDLAAAAAADGQFQFVPGPMQAVTVPVAAGFALPEIVSISGVPPPPSEEGALEEGPGVKMIDYGSDLRSTLPCALLTRVAPSPWSPDTNLVFVALQPLATGQAERPRANLVFLVDVSTSMNAPDRLPMFKEAFSRFLDGLRPDDQVSLVVYAGDSARWLTPTGVHDRETIRRAFARLATTETDRPGASLQIAYDMAHAGFIPGGFNRVIAVTDGDLLNLGITEAGGLYDYVARQARDGVTLSLIGVGREFVVNDKVRALIRNGKGQAAAAKSPGGTDIALDREVTPSTPMAIRNVNLELALAPDRAQAYRLLGYQNQFPVTGTGLSPRPGAGLIAVYETRKTEVDPPSPLEVNLRYHRSTPDGAPEEKVSRTAGASDPAAPEVAREFERQIADLSARLKALPVGAADVKSDAPASAPAPASSDAPAPKPDYQDFKKNAESWIEPAKKAE